MNRKERRAMLRQGGTGAADAAAIQAQFSQALALYQSGRSHEAQLLFRRILAADPGHAHSLNFLGAIARGSGRPDSAIDLLKRAISLNGNVAAYHYNLGNAQRDLSDFDAAIASYRRALGLSPDYPEAHNNLGLLLFAARKFDEAAECFQRALRLKPAFPEAFNNLGNALWKQGRADEALDSYQRALALHPNYLDALRNVAALLKVQGKLEDAVAAYRRALALKPEFPEGFNDLGDALRELGQLDEAVACFRRALELRPGYAEAHSNLGNAFMDLGRPAMAAAEFENAVTLQPDEAGFTWNLALAQLLLGDYQAGWRNYEARRRAEFFVPRAFDAPEWRGETLTRGTILLHVEQGFGDTIQFIRYAELVKRRGARVVVECQPELARVIESAPGVDQVVPWGDPLPAFDFHASLLSLPHLFGTTLTTIPGKPGYLAAPAERVDFWRDRIGRDRPAIGLVWRGAAENKTNRRRSIAPDIMAKLRRPDRMKWFSLQKDARTEEIAALSQHGETRDCGSGLTDWAETAALASCLDLVITVETGVAHLVGALGKPVWILVPFGSDWRWLLGRSDSPWYPTARLFRQPAPGDWEGAIAQVRAALDACWPAPPGP
jgi:tetratricopeptide (TPR) repeat protein